MLVAALALAAGAAVVAVHVFPLSRGAPALAAAAWLLALSIRALLAVAAAVAFLLYLPRTEAFEAAASWCGHVILPFVSDAVRLPAHALADGAAVTPMLALTASVAWMVVGLAAASIALRCYIRRRSLGDGPLGSTLVDDRSPVVATSAIGRPDIVVSLATLDRLDAEEVAAGVSHEIGHLRRNHRPMLLAGRILAATARLVPGTASAHRQLRVSLERDADEYAVRTTGDPLALASAICKMSQGSSPKTAAVGLARDGVRLRLDALIGASPRRDPVSERRSRALVGAMAVVAASLAVALATSIADAPASNHAVQSIVTLVGA